MSKIIAPILTSFILFSSPANAEFPCLFACADVNTEDVKKAAEELKKASDILSKGMDSLDPLALKKLLQENSELREQLNAVSSKLSGYTNSTPVAVLEGQRLQFEVLQYSGGFRVDAWIDIEANWFWQDRRFNDMEQTLPVKDGVTLLYEYLTSPQSNLSPIKLIVLNQKGSQGVNDINIHGKTAVAAIEKHNKDINALFSNFLRDVNPIPAPNQRRIDLNQSFLTEGDHRIYIRITPISNNKNKRWALRGRLVSNQPQNEHIIKEFDVDSDKYRDHNLGSPLPITILYLNVKRNK